MRPGRRAARWLLVLGGSTLVIGISGCGRGAVEAAADPLDPARVPRLALRVAFRLGGPEPATEGLLGPIGPVAFLPDGSLVLGNLQSQVIEVFDGEGRLLASAGGKGGGPGRFQFVAAISPLRGGGFVAWDRVLARLTYYAPPARLERTVTVPVDEGAAPRPWALEFVGAFPDGTAVFRTKRDYFSRRAEPERLARDTVAFLAFSPGSGRWRPLLTRVAPEYLFFRRYENWGGEALLFGRELVAVVAADALTVGDTDSLVLSRYGPGGRRLGVVRIPRPSRPTSPEWVEAERKRRLEEVEKTFRFPLNMSGGAPDPRTVLKEVIREVPSHRTLPAFAGLAAAGAEALWVRDHVPPGAARQRWFLVEAVRGRVAGWIELLAGERLAAAAADRLAVLSKDSLGVETLTVYRLAR